MIRTNHVQVVNVVATRVTIAKLLLQWTQKLLLMQRKLQGTHFHNRSSLMELSHHIHSTILEKCKLSQNEYEYHPEYKILPVMEANAEAFELDSRGSLSSCSFSMDSSLTSSTSIVFSSKILAQTLGS